MEPKLNVSTFIVLIVVNSHSPETSCGGGGVLNWKIEV